MSNRQSNTGRERWHWSISHIIKQRHIYPMHSHSYAPSTCLYDLKWFICSLIFPTHVWVLSATFRMLHCATMFLPSVFISLQGASRELPLTHKRKKTNTHLKRSCKNRLWNCLINIPPLLGHFIKTLKYSEKKRHINSFLFSELVNSIFTWYQHANLIRNIICSSQRRAESRSRG